MPSANSKKNITIYTKYRGFKRCGIRWEFLHEHNTNIRRLRGLHWLCHCILNARFLRKYISIGRAEKSRWTHERWLRGKLGYRIKPPCPWLLVCLFCTVPYPLGNGSVVQLYRKAPEPATGGQSLASCVTFFSSLPFLFSCLYIDVSE